MKASNSRFIILSRVGKGMKVCVCVGGRVITIIFYYKNHGISQMLLRSICLLLFCSPSSHRIFFRLFSSPTRMPSPMRIACKEAISCLLHFHLRRRRLRRLLKAYRKLQVTKPYVNISRKNIFRKYIKYMQSGQG